MAKKLIPMAICYDFDGTLSPCNMQDYDFMKHIKKTPKQFWTESNKFAKEKQADQITAYMYHMLKTAKDNNTSFTKQALNKYGKDIELFNGVDTWFDRINKYAESKGIKLKHYIISSGLLEMLEGTKIKKYFEKIYASSFIYDNNDVASWPAIVINYTSKTQFLFRINKGCEDITDNSKINEYVPPEKRPMPFTNMIYIGDGDTDIPCMKMVKREGGHSIAVYNTKKRGKKEKALKLIKDGRVNAVLAADYSDNKDIDKYVKSIIDNLATYYATKEFEKVKGNK
ncbi:MAG: haloacid dehalogenase-like hydrolase [Alphaproteobacteria bacterium]|nr:haloacid dehalogenase-like hydrolase [Alphaproteobacteria bacterium]